MGRFRKTSYFFLALIASWGLAFAEIFDIFDYTPPQGWKKTALQGGVMFSQQTKESFGSIVLYASVPAGSDAEQNFRGEWKRLVEEGLGVSGDPKIETGPKNGDYENLAGGIQATQDGMDYVVLLSSFSGNGRVASVMYIATDQKLFELFDSFNSSLKLNKPKTAQAPPAGANPPTNTNAPANTRTIATPTTKFDDGWTSTVQNGFVRVAKGEVLVLLYYAIPLPENMWVYGNEKERVAYYWDKVVSSRYKTDQIKAFENGVCYTCLYFGEGNATEIATGAQKYVGLYIYFNKGQGFAIQAIAPSFETFQQYFPNIEALGKMSGYNKFAIKLSDLVGTWGESGGSFMNYYSTTTGAYAGMNAVSSSSTFSFKNDGGYSSKHAGASGFVGAQSFYSQEYKGKITVSDWKITLTNRFGGKTEAYDAYFEMTAAGPVLHLVLVGASGMRYDLMKE